MAKRFTDTEKWTKNKWFRTLSKDLKLFWLFMLDNCDCVGVWEEDVEFVNETLNLSLTKEEILTAYEKQIKIIKDGKKWWIKEFCNYQYGVLKLENIKNKPHQRYIKELKSHRLWIDYTKTMDSLEEEEEEEEEEKEDDNKNGVPEISNSTPTVKPYLELESLKENSLKDENFMMSLYRVGVKPSKVPLWLDAFHKWLLFTDDTVKQMKDYRVHFVNWIQKIPDYLTADPIAYSPMASTDLKTTQPRRRLSDEQ